MKCTHGNKLESCLQCAIEESEVYQESLKGKGETKGEIKGEESGVIIL